MGGLVVGTEVSEEAKKADTQVVEGMGGREAPMEDTKGMDPTVAVVMVAEAKA